MTVYLVRHASAGDRNARDPDDSRRPLDDAGRTQADKLGALLGTAPIVAVISSPAERCAQTVEPVASGSGVEVEINDALFEGASIDDAWELLEKAARADGDVVLCSHGDVIPELIHRAQGRGMSIPGKKGWSKGSCWSLAWDGERFTTATYTPVPA